MQKPGALLHSFIQYCVKKHLVLHGKKLFINSQIKFWYVALFPAFSKTIPHFESQAKFASLSPLPPTKKVIEPQVCHDFLIPITAHDICKD